MSLLKNKKNNLNKKFFVYHKVCDYRTCELIFGSYGLKSLDGNIISRKEFEVLKKILKKMVKEEKGFSWIRIFPHFSKTRKPIDVRMGKGKGSINSFYYFLKPGQIIFEISGLSHNKSIDLLKSCMKILSVRCKIQIKIF